MLTLYLAGGCFWGVQKYFDQFRGVESTEVGYANGPASVRLDLAEGAGVTGTSGAKDVWEEYVFSEDNPPYYDTVCAGVGFAETVKVVYDPKVLPTKTLLGYYFDVIDPLAVNRQGPDSGVQYRTGIYYEESAAGELLREFEDVADGRPAESVQSLVIVPDDADVLPRPAEQEDELFLDVVRVLAEAIVPVGRELTALGIQRAKMRLHLARPGRQRAHELGIKEVARRNIVVDQAARDSRVAERVKDRLKRRVGGKRRILGRDLVERENLQQSVAGADAVLTLNQAGVNRVLEQRV